MPWCSVLWLESGLGCVGLCWGPSVMLRSCPSCRGLAKEVMVVCPAWCGSVLVYSVSVLCLRWLGVGLLYLLLLDLG